MNKGNCRLKTGQEVSMKMMKKDVFLRAMTAALVIFLSLFLVTCEAVPPDFSESGDTIEWLDWKYEDNNDGSGKLTLMLDGSTPFAYNKQARGLNVGMARMIHDYFEAVFVFDTEVRRTTWEIGYPAGVSGLSRGKDYGPVYGGDPDDDEGNSVVFVGKKQGKTLLGIGHLVQVNEGPAVVYNTAGDDSSGNSTIITPNATSVLYAVYPFITKVGWTAATGGGSDTWNGENTFLTNVTSTGTLHTAVASPLATPTAASSGKLISLPGNVKYPLFDMPPAPTDDTLQNVLAEYEIKLPAISSNTAFPGRPDLWESARIVTTTIGLDTIGLEIIKRYAAYQVQGQTFDASTSLDTYTAVEATNNQTTGAFDPKIKMTFIQNRRSIGIFAITFQCPVNAITGADSNVSGATAVKAEKWFIRPGYNQYQYLLDNGEDAGGMVMLGKLAGGSTDWIEIFTTGIGFSNN
jgi:hypothetical protein